MEETRRLCKSGRMTTDSLIQDINRLESLLTDRKDHFDEIKSLLGPFFEALSNS